LVGKIAILKESPSQDDVATDASYRIPPMALTSPATIPPEAVVEVPTPQALCACGEVLQDEDDGKELVLYVDDDGTGDVVETDSSEEHFPNVIAPVFRRYFFLLLDYLSPTSTLV